MTDPKEVERVVNEATRSHLRSERAHKELRLLVKQNKPAPPGALGWVAITEAQQAQARREIAIITLLEDLLETLK